MAASLFDNTELAAHKKKLNDLEKARKNDGTGSSWTQYWNQTRAVEEAHLVEQVKRAQKRPRDFLNALLILVASRGSEYVVFEDAFVLADTAEYQKKVESSNNPETRRALYTILRALTEIPKSWATSAFIRFLRGSGKQKDSKYHGAGTFGVLYGWKEKEINAICKWITGGGDYSNVLMSYADVHQEVNDAQCEEAAKGEYTIEYGTEFVATRVERDVEFLNELCDLLEKDGLGPIPTPEEAKPKKERKVKQFKPGDKISKTNLRDLPLPAHIRLDVEKHDETSKQWVSATIERVVTFLENSGYYHYANVKPGTKIAYKDGSFSMARKAQLDGATYLGKWPGTISKKDTMRLKFQYRFKNGSY